MRDIVFSAAPVLAFVLTGRSALVLYRSERRASAALSDPISGLPTVTAFDRTAARGLEAAGRYGGSEALIVMDIDRFGERVGNYLIIAGSIAALVLTMAAADRFI